MQHFSTVMAFGLHFRSANVVFTGVFYCYSYRILFELLQHLRFPSGMNNVAYH